MRDVTDGTSHTIIVGESPEGLHSIWIGHKNFFDQSAPLSRWRLPADGVAVVLPDVRERPRQVLRLWPGVRQLPQRGAGPSSC